MLTLDQNNKLVLELDSTNTNKPSGLLNPLDKDRLTLNLNGYQKERLDKIGEEMKYKMPVYAGCNNKMGGCYCTGRCKEVLYYRDMTPAERMNVDFYHPPMF